MSNEGYTTTHWRQSIHERNCSNFFVTDGIQIAGDDSNCTVTNALLLLLRQSYRYNSKKWADDVRHTSTRIDRTLMAHELMPLGAQHNLDLHYAQPSTTCMLTPNDVANDAISPVITSVTLLTSDADSATFALFGAPTKSSKFAQVRVFTNLSTVLSVGDAPGLHALNNHSPSAAFLLDGSLAAGNMGWNDYDVTVYSKDGANYTDMRLSPSYRVGGENIGSLFRSNGSVLMSARFNVPYVPLDVSGHGYRSIGLYNITTSPPQPRSDLVDWVSPDGCMSVCIDEMNQTCAHNLTLNASSLLLCLPDFAAGSINETLYTVCLRSALSHHADDDCQRRKASQFVDGVLCAHRCRSEHQIYMPAISSVNGLWYGVAGLTSYKATTERNDAHHDQSAATASPVALCRLSKSFAWNPGCFDVHSALMRDVKGSYGHPLTSEIVQLNSTLLLASLAPLKANVSESCATYLHAWNLSTFSYFQVRKDGPSGASRLVLSNVALPATRRVRVLISSTDVAAPCSGGIKMFAYGRQLCRTTHVVDDDDGGDPTFEINCGLATPIVDLHIFLPPACRLYGVGPSG